jgi:hypothetical protein
MCKIIVNRVSYLGLVLDPKIRERFSKASSTLEAIILSDASSSSHFIIELQEAAS